MWLYCEASLTKAPAFWPLILPTAGDVDSKRDA
jgi:hypothetical protein